MIGPFKVDGVALDRLIICPSGTWNDDAMIQSKKDLDHHPSLETYSLQAMVPVIMFAFMLVGIGCNRTVDHSERKQMQSQQVELAEAAELDVNDEKSDHSVAIQNDFDASELTVSDPSFDHPVTAAIKFSVRKVGDPWLIDVQVSVRILSGHYIYGKLDGDTPFQPLKVELTLPEGVARDSEWIFPVPFNQNGHAIYIDSVSLSCQLRSSAVSKIPVQTVIHLQSCSEEVCFPPTTIELRDSIIWQE